MVPLFFVRFLTDKGDLVLDPFAGSNTTGEACEAEGRRWVAIECDKEYLETSRYRFEARAGGVIPSLGSPTAPKKPWPGKQATSKGNGQRELFG